MLTDQLRGLWQTDSWRPALLNRLEIGAQQPIYRTSLLPIISSWMQHANIPADRWKLLGFGVSAKVHLAFTGNPATAAVLAKQASEEGKSIRELALEKAAAGEMRHRDEDRSVSSKEIETALDDLRGLTEGGIVG